MKVVLLAAIRGYWRFWPARWARSCVFRESCSRHVYRIATDHGGRAGLAALLRRYRQCRPGYGRVQVGEDRFVCLSDGSCVGEIEVADDVWSQAWR